MVVIRTHKMEHWDSVSHEKQKYNDWRDSIKYKAIRNDGEM